VSPIDTPVREDGRSGSRPGGATAHGLAYAAEAGPLGVGPGLAVAGDANDDQARVLGQQAGRIEVPALQRAWPEVLDQDVGAGDEIAGHRLPLRAPQVEAEGLLVARDHFPPDRGLSPAPGAHGIAGAGLFELDHLRAHVAEQLAAERAGDQLARLHHPQALQGAPVLALHGLADQNLLAIRM
jgi:hypothetical protein